MTAKKGGAPKKPITIRGVEYPSQGAAAIALGVNTSRISKACKNGALEKVGLGGKGAPKKQIKVSGRTFDGLEAAAEFYGVSLQRFSSFGTVSKRIAEVEAELAKTELQQAHTLGSSMLHEQTYVVVKRK